MRKHFGILYVLNVLKLVMVIIVKREFRNWYFLQLRLYDVTITAFAIKTY